MTAALSMPMWTLGGADLLEAAKVRDGPCCRVTV